MKQAIAVKLKTGAGTFRYADCPYCDECTVLQGEKPNTITDKVFCLKCGKMFQLSQEMVEKDYVKLHFEMLEN